MASKERNYAALLKTIRSVQADFIAERGPSEVFEGLLKHLLSISRSEYGFIGQVLHDNDGAFLKTHAISNIAWNDDTREFYATNAPDGLEFRNLETLFGQVIVTGEPVIANEPSTDSRSGGLPEGHPDLNAFLGIPLYHGSEMIGMAGIANHEGGYDKDDVEFLQPLLATTAHLIDA